MIPNTRLLQADLKCTKNTKIINTNVLQAFISIKSALYVFINSETWTIASILLATSQTLTANDINNNVKDVSRVLEWRLDQELVQG